MKIDVPFHKQSTPLNCGPTCLKMIFEYFGKHYSIEEIDKFTGIKEGKGISTTQLAIVAAKAGLKVEFYSISLVFNPENANNDFFKRYGDDSLILHSDKILKEAQNLGVHTVETSLALNEVLSKLSKDCIPLVLINWGVIVGQDIYHGHFVPIVGYDDTHVYIHNPGWVGTEKFMPLDRDLFNRARISKATDEDILFIKKH